LSAASTRSRLAACRESSGYSSTRCRLMIVTQELNRCAATCSRMPANVYEQLATKMQINESAATESRASATVN
jgi:hypothetical protein